MPNCNPSDLAVFVPDSQNLWNKKKVQHLYRRLGFSMSNTNIQTALSNTPSVLIDSLFDNAIALGVMPPPTWANMAESDYTDPDNEIPLQHEVLYYHFVDDMLKIGRAHV